jgi:hypothetical protein
MKIDSVLMLCKLLPFKCMSVFVFCMSVQSLFPPIPASGGQTTYKNPKATPDAEVAL